MLGGSRDAVGDEQRRAVTPVFMKWTCASQSLGIANLPLASTRRAFAGIATADDAPMARITGRDKDRSVGNGGLRRGGVDEGDAIEHDGSLRRRSAENSTGAGSCQEEAASGGSRTFSKYCRTSARYLSMVAVCPITKRDTKRNIGL